MLRLQYKYELVQRDNHLPLKIIIHQYNRPVHVPLHWHDSVEISYVLSGKIDDIYIDGAHYSSNAGDIVVINSKALHSFTTRNNGDREAVTILIPYDFIKPCVQGSEPIEFDCISIVESDQRRLAHFAELRKLLNAVVVSHLKQHRDEFAHVHLTALSYQIIYVLLKYFRIRKEEKQAVQTSKHRERLLSIKNYVERHYDQNLSVEQIAHTFQLSPQYMSRFFIKHTGMTLFQYINELRLEKAYRDLMNTDLSILNVAMNHGFPNEKSFIRVFKNGYGVTPYQYRKARKGSMIIKDEN